MNIIQWLWIALYKLEVVLLQVDFKHRRQPLLSTDPFAETEFCYLMSHHPMFLLVSLAFFHPLLAQTRALFDRYILITRESPRFQSWLG